MVAVAGRALFVVLSGARVADLSEALCWLAVRRADARRGRARQRIPERIVELAVKGMLPKGRLGRHLFTHLKVYKGPEHPHSAQKPANITAKINKNAAAAAAAVPV
jgi:ribosomal protein L13